MRPPMESLGVVWFLDSFWFVRPRPANTFDVGREHHTLLFVCVCVWGHYAGAHVCGCQTPTLCPPGTTHLIYLRQGLTHWLLALTVLMRWTSNQAPEIPQFLPPGYWNYKQLPPCPAFNGCWEAISGPHARMKST